MSPKDLALTLARIADNKKGEDVRVLEVTDLTTLADYFVICTGTSTTHLKTLSGEMELGMKDKGVVPHHTEGRESGNWLLLDYGCVIVHLFLRDTRAFYSLEHLWADAKEVAFGGK